MQNRYKCRPVLGAGARPVTWRWWCSSRGAPIEETGTIPALMVAARRRGVTERQVALAWLLSRSPQVLPIPGSGDPDHVEQNVPAASIELTDEEIRAITLAAVSR